MASRFLLLFSLATVCIVGALSATDCSPDCSGKNFGDCVENPYNCSEYYICGDDGLPTDEALPCPPGNYFPPDGTKCEPLPNPPCISTCTSACHFTCSGTGDFISDPTNCKIYYVCAVGGVPQGPYECPPNYPYYDANSRSCKDSDSVCCQDVCTAYCFGDLLQIVDPYNCTNFYICEGVGNVQESHHFSCPEGENFNIPSGKCDPYAGCTTLCGNGGQGNDSCLSVPYTCTATGFIPRCTTCQAEYFICNKVGDTGMLSECNSGYVFNTVPDYPYCVRSEQCPYYGTRVH